MSDPEYTVNLTINYDVAASRLVGALRSVSQHVTLALCAVEAFPDAELLNAPDTFFQLHLGGPAKSTPETRLAFNSWVVCTGLHGGVSAVERFAIEMRRLLALLTCQKPLIKAEESGTPKQVIQRFMHAAAKPFEKATWPKRLEQLRVLGIEPVLSDAFTSIVRARNCLVHRSGIVSDRDVDHSNSMLSVEYKAVRMFSVGQDGKEDTISKCNTFVPRDRGIWVRQDRELKSFRIGERVSFTAQEFQFLMLTLHWFGVQMLEGVKAAGLRAGIPHNSGELSKAACARDCRSQT